MNVTEVKDFLLCYVPLVNMYSGFSSSNVDKGIASTGVERMVITDNFEINKGKCFE